MQSGEKWHILLPVGKLQEGLGTNGSNKVTLVVELSAEMLFKAQNDNHRTHKITAPPSGKKQVPKKVILQPGKWWPSSAYQAARIVPVPHFENF